MKCFLNLILTIFIAGCGENNFNNTYESSPKERLANEISKKVALQLKRDKNLSPFGFGGGTMNHIRMLALSFLYHQETSIDEARELLVGAGTLFLKTINEDERIRPYLKNYPFEPKNIEIRIFLQNPNGSQFGDEKLCVVSMMNSKLEYNIDNVETQRLTTIYEESFEEAAAKLNKVHCVTGDVAFQ